MFLGERKRKLENDVTIVHIYKIKKEIQALWKADISSRGDWPTK